MTLDFHIFIYKMVTFISMLYNLPEKLRKKNEVDVKLPSSERGKPGHKETVWLV